MGRLAQFPFSNALGQFYTFTYAGRFELHGQNIVKRHPESLNHQRFGLAFYRQTETWFLSPMKHSVWRTPSRNMAR
jgi:hypothetical protein